MPAKRRCAPAILLMFPLLAGCGGPIEADRLLAARTTTTPLVAEDRQVESHLVSEADVARAPAGSARRAFLEYWNAISFEDWATAVRYLDVSVRKELKPGYLVDALRTQGKEGMPVKPLIRTIIQRRGNTSIRYYVRTDQGQLRPTSSTWRRRKDGRWFLVYSAALDESYGSAVQLSVQNETDPESPTASAQAIKAGRRATRAQARTLAP